MPKKETKKGLGIGEATRFKAGAEQAEIARKGGLASQQVQHQKRNMAQLAQIMLNSALDPAKKDAVKKVAASIDDDDATVAAMMMAAQVNSAIKGNTKAFNALMELAEKAGGADKDGAQYRLPAEVIGKAFVDINRQIEPNRTYIFKGGRGGLKSSYVSLKIIELIKNNPSMHACVVRKVGNTLRDSVYAQIKWAINELGLAGEFDWKVNPLEIIYRKTGQRIFFRGADDPIKLKSIKPEFGYIGILWIEERDQLSGPSEERSIKQSVLRGGMLSFDFASYNPPKSKSNWVNQELLTPDKNRTVHHSSYLDAPIEWLGQKFIDDAEHLREVNPEAYEHEYMGEPNGDGGSVFEYLEVREIADEEVARFDTIYQGVDWGWHPDPFCFIRLAYESAQDTIYIFDEIYVTKTPNTVAAEMIKERSYDDYPITCDSAENKSINDFRDLALPARPALKGPGSVDYGMKFLQGRRIVIDPNRAPNAAREFSRYEYERDKDGNVVSGYPDKDNHTIDAVRYALEKFYNMRGNNA